MKLVSEFLAFQADFISHLRRLCCTNRTSELIALPHELIPAAPAIGKRGRHHTFTDPAIQFCLSIKCLFGLALRQSLGLIQSLLHLAGLDWRVPDFSTSSRRQRTLQVQLPYRSSSKALDLRVDSTGTKFPGEGEWKRKKHRTKYRRQ